jgi:hypothetical protein
MQVRFQGIVVLTGTEEAVDKAVKKHEKGNYVTATRSKCETNNDVVVSSLTVKTILTDKDQVAFWKERGIDAERKTPFKLLHPIRSLKAIIGEMQDKVDQMMNYMNKDLSRFNDDVDNYVKQHSEADISGKPVKRLSV